MGAISITSGINCSGQLWPPAGVDWLVQFPDGPNVIGGSYTYSTAELLGSPQATFTRASGGTYIDSAGAVQSFPSNALRLGDRGALIEPERTNVILDSSNSLGAWVEEGNTAIAVHSAPAPDGSLSAQQVTVTANSGSGNHVSPHGDVSAPGAQTVVSVWARRDQHPFLKLFGFQKGAAGVTFDLVNLIAQVNDKWDAADIVAVNDEWAICSGVLIPVGTRLAVAAATDLGGSSDLEAGDTIVIWNAQVEEGSAATSPIITSGAAPVTRAADALTFAVADGVYDIAVTFDDASTQQLPGEVVSGGEGWTVPVTLAKRTIRSISARLR